MIARIQLHNIARIEMNPSGKAKLVFLCLNLLAPSYLLLLFIVFWNIHSYSTRQKSRLLIPRVKSNFDFIKMPTDTTKAEDIQAFCAVQKGFYYRNGS